MSRTTIIVTILGIFIFGTYLFLHQNVKKQNCRTSDCVDTLVVVLCDVTRSVDSTVNLNVQNEAKQIFDTFYNKTRLKYFQLNNSDYNRAVFEYIKRPLFHSNRIEREAATRTLDSIRQKLIQSVKYDTAINYQETSLTLGLNSIYEFIKHLDTNYNHIPKKLFILSDMIEDSNDDPRFGTINFKSREATQELINKLKSEKDFEINKNLKKQGVKIYVVFSSQNLATKKRPEQTSMTRMELEDAWRLIFTRFGYSALSDSLSFSLIDLPGNFRQ